MICDVSPDTGVALIFALGINHRAHIIVVLLVVHHGEGTVLTSDRRHTLIRTLVTAIT